MRRKLFRGSFLAAFLTVALAMTAQAQTVSSEARGVIKDQSGSGIENATVTITHVPSASRRSTTTGPNGGFFQPGLRVGGPYTITVSADGYQGATHEQVFLSPSTNKPIELTLQPEAMEEIVTTATRTPLLDLNNGVGSAFTASDITNMPATNRDVIRTLVRDPLAQSDGSDGNLSVAGVNPRFNGLAIDGTLQQDDFGLGDSTYATARSPINLDAIESASVVAADYDVESQGFTGGLVNVTIKSGTNDFDGTVYYDFVNDSMIGDRYDGGTFNPGQVDDKEYGLTFGGPILRDRLFFFLSYDEFEASQSVDYTNSDANDGIPPGFFDALRQEILNGTGYDPGTRPTSASIPETSERTLAKIDWNINDLHRASFTYQSTEETGISTSQTSFEGAWYDIPVDLKAYTFQLYSDWSDRLSTTLRMNQKDFTRGQLCRAGPSASHIEVENLGVGDLGLTDVPGDIIAGCDRFRHANEFDDERLQILAKGDYFIGDHVITAGLEYEDFQLRNLFLQSSRGRFQYDGLGGLAANNADISYINVPSNNTADGASNWGYNRWSFFVQDSIQLNPDLEITLGLRYETFDQSDNPAYSSEIDSLYGVRSDANLDGKDLVLPRVSFRWTPTDRSVLSGGFGLFSGGDPKVWISNAFQPLTAFASGNFTGVAPGTIPQSLLDSVAAATGTPIDVISEGFEIPADWKASLRYEQDLDLGVIGDDYTLSAQYLYTATQDGFVWRNLAQTRNPLALPTGVAPDGRVIYADLQALQSANPTENLNNLTLLDNHSDGKSHVFSVALAKQFDNGFSFNVSYAHQDVEIVSEGTSSRGISNWRGITDIDRNFPGAKPSPFQVEHAFKLAMGWEKDFFNTGQSHTRIDVFLQRLSGDPYYHTFALFSSSNSLFGRASQGESPFWNNPLYIPTGPSDPLVVYDSSFDQSGFSQYVQDLGIPSGIQEPFSAKSGWNTLLDLRISQEIPGLPFLGDTLGDNSFTLYLNIDNFLNLLNSDWGRFTNGPGFGQNAVLQADLVSAADVAANGVDAAAALTGDSMRTTCTTASACVYRFNTFRNPSTDITSSSDSVYYIRAGFKWSF